MKPFAAWLSALIGCFLLVLLIVVGSGLSGGLSIAQRVMTDLAMPVGLAWLSLLAATIYQWQRGGRHRAYGFGGAFLAVTLLFSPWVSSLAVAAIETPPLAAAPTSAAAPVYSALVVLGGGAGRNSAGHAELGGSGERLALAAKLWHAGKTGAIICTGTSQPCPLASASPLTLDRDDPAAVGHEILTALAVPQARIFHSAGENTAAEIRHLAVLLNEPPPGLDVSGKLGLITSAFHLPRAMRLANAAGLTFEPLPAGNRGYLRNDRGIGILVPTAGAGEVVALVAKEWLARLLGR